MRPKDPDLLIDAVMFFTVVAAIALAVWVFLLPREPQKAPCRELVLGQYVDTWCDPPAP